MIDLIKHDNNKEYPQEGYQKLIQNGEFLLPKRTQHQGWLSTCVDARIPHSLLRRLLGGKEPITTAGNAYPNGLTKQVESSGKKPLRHTSNVVITHGVEPLDFQTTGAHCGGHALAFDKLREKSIPPGFDELSKSLEGTIITSENDFDTYGTAKALGNIWDAGKNIYLYDHIVGKLLDPFGERDPLNLDLDPRSQTFNIQPAHGQDPMAIVINTTGFPIFEFTIEPEVTEIGSVFEIFYPNPELPEETIQSIIYGVKSHLDHKDQSGYGHFAHSDTVIIAGRSSKDIERTVENLLTSKHEINQEYIRSFGQDPKDLIIGLVPATRNSDTELYKIIIS